MNRMSNLAIALLTAFALTACGGDSTSPTDTGGGSNGGGTGGGGTGGDGGGGTGGDGGGGNGDAAVEIRMQNTAFVAPGGGDAVTVTVGTTIEWVNMDGIQHTATSTSEPVGGAAFDSGIMGNGDRFQFTPQVTGTWTYLCEVHPGIMQGATITATSSSSGDSGGNDPPTNPDMPGDPDYPSDPVG